MLHISRPDTVPAPGAQLDANGAAQAWRRDVVLKQILRPHAPARAAISDFGPGIPQAMKKR